MKLAEAPNMIKMAGPIQQEAAKNEAKIVPMFEMFSVFITVNQSYLAPRPREVAKSNRLSVCLPMNDSLGYCATDGRI